MNPFLRKLPKISGPVFLVLLFITAWCLQEQLFLNWDASWLMHAAERLWEGGTYSGSYFETNPPLILFLYMPVVLLAKLLHASTIILFRVYIFGLALFSLVLSYPLLCQLFKASWQRKTFLAGLLTVYLILPLHELGQRDHLLVILTLPYLLLLACRLEGLAAFSWPRALTVGLLAGMGFALKPHFWLAPLALECYTLYRQRSFASLWRPELLALGFFVLTYFLAVRAYFPDYFSFIVPFSLRHYYMGISSSWLELVTQPLFLLCALPFLLYHCLYTKTKASSLLPVLSIALCCFMFSYLAQRTVFYYHMIPFYSLLVLLLLLLMSDILKEDLKHQPFLTLFMAILVFTLPLQQGRHIYQHWVSHKQHLQPLISFMQKEAHHRPVFFFASTTIYTFPTVDYAEASFASRIPFMWMVSGLVNEQDSMVNRLDKERLGNMIAEDFIKQKPLLVFVDAGTFKPYIKQKNFDYLEYFKSNPYFAHEWLHYAYFTTLTEPGLYTLKVYKRTGNSTSKSLDASLRWHDKVSCHPSISLVIPAQAGIQSSPGKNPASLRWYDKGRRV